jgi:hypothetical protein
MVFSTAHQRGRPLFIVVSAAYMHVYVYDPSVSHLFTSGQISISSHGHPVVRFNLKGIILSP